MYVQRTYPLCCSLARIGTAKPIVNPVLSKNSIVLVFRKIARFARVVACQNASGSGSIYLSHHLYRRLDESTAAASHRISDGGKSCAAGADRHPSHAFYR